MINYKIFNEHSIKLESLDPSFLPIAKHLIKFLDEWTSKNTYSYEIICTGRSWYTQKEVTMIDDDRRNGLSWYLYGKAISINIYKKEQDEFFTETSNTDFIKKTINFTDGSANEFLDACQLWFINNPLNGNIVKICGAYPTIKDNLKLNSNKIISDHINDEYSIYWGGIFSAYSNYTHFEWHPGIKPSEIYEYRNNYLNVAYDNYDLLLAIIDEIPTSDTKYLNNDLEIIVEDFIAIWKLKNKISMEIPYYGIDIISWANSNNKSLKQAIIYYTLLGDYNNAYFFKLLYDEKAIVSITTNNYSILHSSISIEYNEYSEYTINYYNEFDELIKISSDSQYILPFDDPKDVLNIDLNLSQYSEYSNNNETLGPINPTLIENEINNNSDFINPNFEVNEHGLIGDLTINPNKTINNTSDAESISNSLLVFEEMITPPNQESIQIRKKILDLSKIVKATNNSTSEEMISPPLP